MEYIEQGLKLEVATFITLLVAPVTLCLAIAGLYIALLVDLIPHHIGLNGMEILIKNRFWLICLWFSIHARMCSKGVGDKNASPSLIHLL